MHRLNVLARRRVAVREDSLFPWRAWLLSPARAEDLVGGVEDALRGTLRNGLALAPFLNVASAVFSAGQPQRLAA